MASSVEGFSTIAERSRRVGRTKSAIKPARIRSDEGRLGDRCRERFTIKSWCLRRSDSATSVPLTVFGQSPLFNNAPFTMNGVNVGNTQYVDAFQRANFWTAISPAYHTRLGTITIAAAQRYDVPVGSGAVYSDFLFGNGGCGPHNNP